MKRNGLERAEIPIDSFRAFITEKPYGVMTPKDKKLLRNYRTTADRLARRLGKLKHEVNRLARRLRKLRHDINEFETFSGIPSSVMMLMSSTFPTVPVIGNRASEFPTPGPVGKGMASMESLEAAMREQALALGEWLRRYGHADLDVLYIVGWILGREGNGSG
jgi:hypothetical protein